MIEIVDKRNDYKYYIDLDDRYISVYWKLNSSDYACIYDNMVPAKEGVIYNYEDIKENLQPIKDDHYIKLHGSWYSYNVDSIRIKYNKFDFEFKKYINCKLYADRNFEYNIFRKNNEIVFWNGSSYSEENQILDFLKYLYDKDNGYMINIGVFSGILILNRKEII